VSPICKTYVPGRQGKFLIHLCIYGSEYSIIFYLSLIGKTYKNPLQLFKQRSKLHCKDHGTQERRRTLASEDIGFCHLPLSMWSLGLIVLLFLHICFLYPFICPFSLFPQGVRWSSYIFSVHRFSF